MRIYLSIPISSMDEKKQREKADRIKAALSRKGHTVINPFDIIVDKNNPDWFDHMGADLRELSKCDAIFLCNGWKGSKGCNLEMSYAISMGIRQMFETVEQPQIYYNQ